MYKYLNNSFPQHNPLPHTDPLLAGSGYLEALATAGRKPSNPPLLVPAQ